MQNTKILNIFSGLIVLALIIFAVYFSVFKRPSVSTLGGNPISTSTTSTSPQPVQYKNSDYGFTFSLPDSWKGYTIITDEWDGYSISSDGMQQVNTQSGPFISIRHPDWTDDNPRQDIPIMVFTLDQWNKLQNDEFHIGAAPIGPSELGRNSKYVFALPARYNFSFPTGFEEVDQIVKGDNFKTF